MTDLFPYKILIPRNIPESNHDDVLNWLIDIIDECNWDVKKIDNNLYICFVNVEDAVAFKTVWFRDEDENF